MDITILYGTETGNTEMLAEDLQAELQGAHQVECCNLSDFTATAFDPAQFYLVLCSTYGDGELPASAKPFAETLAAQGANLAGVSFAIFGLGSQEYAETFNHGPKYLAELLQAHGATQVGERIAHDAAGADMAEDIAFPWAEAVIAEMQGAQE